MPQFLRALHHTTSWLNVSVEITDSIRLNITIHKNAGMRQMVGATLALMPTVANNITI